MTETIRNYFMGLTGDGWQIRQVYKGDYIPTFEFEKFVVDMGGLWIDHKRIEITLYAKNIKKGLVFLLNNEIYSNEEEIILELNRLGIK